MTLFWRNALRHVSGSLALLVAVSSCLGKPGKIGLQSQAPHCPKFAGPEKGLWIAMSNNANGGVLARMDLSSCRINLNVRETGPDAVLIPDSPERLILLNRMRNDGVVLLEGAEARVKAEHALPERSNPQHAARDAGGNLWVVSQDSNEVHVLRPDLSSEAGKLDLSALTEKASPSGDNLAELAQVAALDSGRMLITAQRLRRTVNAWTPAEKAGYALVSATDFNVDLVGDLEISNPIAVRVAGSDVLVAGSGNLSSAGEASGGYTALNQQAGVWSAPQSVPYRILDADIRSATLPPAIIAFYPQEKKSCIQVGDTRLACEGNERNGGFVFRKVLRVDNTLFAAYSDTGNAELWIIPTDGSIPIQKLTIGPTVGSLAVGP